ncbi:MAG TPA: dihydrodipicolinate reductase C-terminal domain-containing protein [Blastocatellia bacterium]|jgi:4-hydroxy-tetrahydrodipicolinate reductase
MKLALLGYGKMGRMVEEAAATENIEVVAVIDPITGSRGQIADADVCIDFTEAGAVLDNIRLVASAGAAMVVGTTGWYGRIDEVKSLVEESDIGFVYGSNFSIGVNLMFKVVRYAAQLFSRFPDYDPFIHEAHHRFKKDAPSGTAVFLKRIVESAYNREAWTSSTRAGHIPGTHTVGFDSEADTLTITHAARSREGFARGAIVAARWIAERKGFYEFSEIIDELSDLNTDAG